MPEAQDSWLRHDRAVPGDRPIVTVDGARLSSGGRLHRVWMYQGLIAAIALVTLWQSVSRTLEAYLAVPYPGLALALRPSDPLALLNRADEILNPRRLVEVEPLAKAPNFATGLSANADRINFAELEAPLLGGATLRPAEAGEVRALATRALEASPLKARAFRILGELEDRVGHRQAARTLMANAARLSAQETRAVTWLLVMGLRERNYPEVLHQSDVLLRTHPQLVSALLPLLARLSETDAAVDSVKALLIENPPWRDTVLMTLVDTVANPRAPLGLLLALKQSATPPAPVVIKSYTDALARRGLYDLAYEAWLAFLSPEQLRSVGLLYNGRFDQKIDGQVFNWNLPSNPGVTVEVVPMPDADAQKALMVEFGEGRIEFGGVHQVVMLAGGAYVFKGQFKSEFVGRRGLSWYIKCMGGSDLAEGPMVTGVTAGWKPFEMAFTIPPSGCPAQDALLWFDARSASERLARGAIWYRNLQIVRVEGPLGERQVSGHTDGGSTPGLKQP